MFDWVHNHKRWMQLLLGLVALPFAFFGVESYQAAANLGVGVASVGDQKITEQEFAENLRQQQERLRRMLGGNFSQAMLDSPEMRSEMLEGMISQRLLTQYAVSSKLSVSDEQLRDVVASIPAFQVDGKFSKTQYESALRAEGYSPTVFENSIRRDLMMQQLSAALSESGTASKSVAQYIAEYRLQQREVAEYALNMKQFMAQIKPTAEAVQAYYGANSAQFQLPEQVRIEYVVLNGDALLAAEPVQADEIKKIYQDNLAKYGEAEQRQASHILIAYKQGASDGDKAKAREKANLLAEQVKKTPAIFTELAKKNSDDPGSASKGGDLGYFSRGMMVKAFEETAFGMKSGEIAGPIESDFGLHIIRLTGIKPGKVKSFDQVRPEIEAELKKQKSGRRFSEAAEAFSNMVYEQSDSLKPAAERFKLTIQQSGWATRASAPVVVLNNPKLLAALFSDDVIKNHRNTEAVEIAPGTLVSARALEHKAASQRPLDEVRAEVLKRLVDKEATMLARKQGAEKLAELNKGDATGISFGGAKMVSRDSTAGLRPEAAGRVFRADVTKLPAYVGVDLPDGYAIYRISKVVAGKAVDEAMQKNMQSELARLNGTQEFKAFLASLRAGAKIQINKDLLQKKQ